MNNIVDIGLNETTVTGDRKITVYIINGLVGIEEAQADISPIATDGRFPSWQLKL